jgi:hypothetical protein
LNPLPDYLGINGIPRNRLPDALAVLVAFQDEFDLSVRLELDALANGGAGQWRLIANTLADLTKRENRFGHYGYVDGQPNRQFPFAAVSLGNGTTANVQFVPNNSADVPTRWGSGSGSGLSWYEVRTQGAPGIAARPFAYGPGGATASAILAADGRVVRVVHGPAPLWGARRGEDIMLTNVLGFDLRVYDPGAPLFSAKEIPGNASSPIAAVLEPTDPAWSTAYGHSDNMGSGIVGSAVSTFPFAGQGAYVDLGYIQRNGLPSVVMPSSASPTGDAWIMPWFGDHGQLRHVNGTVLAPGYSVYDTWSTHYENNGVDEDGDGLFDEGTNGLDDDLTFGPDDVGERETAPPYDRPLRGVQVVLRAYEPDSRQIRQVRVTQHFLPE